MISRIKQVNLDILQIAKSILDNSKPKVKGLYPKLFNYINIYDSQIDEMIQTTGNKGYSFRTPSFFIQITLGEAVPMMDNFTSYPNTILRFYLVNQLLNAGDDMEQNLQIFDIRDKFVNTFKNCSISWCSSPILYEDEMDYKHGSIYKYKVAFKTCFIDSIGSYLDPDSGFPSASNIGNLDVEVTLENNN
jgi:hypothetical protein